ncbi:uncharacterized protein A4U43_C03F20770 [Asparagus officinalis]|uniref:Uncharacterized protein n=1 Tax=Asparagus officinalis TaxID=4686 RepID=A0A5P1FG01_ASPOF|nr:uncharacterized protein A4U43_C03F20770 [Asparagus officinalis]
MGRIKSSRPSWRIAFRGSLAIVGTRTMSGSSRPGSYMKAEPLDRLKKMHVLFQEQMSELAQKPVPETKDQGGRNMSLLKKHDASTTWRSKCNWIL